MYLNACLKIGEIIHTNNNVNFKAPKHKIIIILNINKYTMVFMKKYCKFYNNSIVIFSPQTMQTEILQKKLIIQYFPYVPTMPRSNFRKE